MKNLGMVFVLAIFLMVLAAPIHANNLYLSIRMDKNWMNESYILSAATVMGGAPVAADPQVSGDYRLDVVENQQVIFSQSFPRPEEMVFTDTLDGGGATVQNASSISLYVPYVSEKQVASLYFKGARVATYTFTNLCNRNSRCEGEEDYLSCPSDCAKKNIDAYSAMYIATTNESSIPGIND
ncbi:hypothetical protein COS70_05040, partial [Candidatus Micrarchaeota archaeon CG06_land_8_20_14_3_00_50_6]